MTSPELLRFFHAEAREYLDAIDGLLSVDGDFEAGAFVAASRALRGSATMARVPRVAEIALAMERIANGVRDGELSWSPRLRHDLVNSVADLRAFVAASEHWTYDDDRRAIQRLGLIRAHLPATRTTPSAGTASTGTTPIFIALQASAIATDLESFLADPVERGLVDDVVNRLRSLRGIAGVSDHPPLGEVADAVERALRALAPDALLREADTEFLSAAAGVFRRASSDLRTRGQFDKSAAEVDRFARATIAADATPEGEEPVMRIEELYYTDMGPHLVQRGAAPSRSAEARFRDDVVARAEHLRRLVAEARVAMDPFTRERVRRDLKTHLSRLEDFARSYGAQQVAAVTGEAASLDSFVDPSTLDAIEAVARVLITPGVSLDDMERRLAVGERQRRETPTPVRVTTLAPSRQAPTPPSTPTSGRALHDLLGTSLSRLASLEDEPLAEPAKVDDDAVVPVDRLVYRGRAALERAREVRDRMRATGDVDAEALQELYELLDLARAE